MELPLATFLAILIKNRCCFPLAHRAAPFFAARLNSAPIREGDKMRVVTASGAAPALAPHLFLMGREYPHIAAQLFKITFFFFFFFCKGSQFSHFRAPSWVPSCRRYVQRVALHFLVREKLPWRLRILGPRFCVTFRASTLGMEKKCNSISFFFFFFIFFFTFFFFSKKKKKKKKNRGKNSQSNPYFFDLVASPLRGSCGWLQCLNTVLTYLNPQTLRPHPSITIIYREDCSFFFNGSIIAQFPVFSPLKDRYSISFSGIKLSSLNKI